MLSNSWLIFKISEFGNFFDAYTHVFNNSRIRFINRHVDQYNQVYEIHQVHNILRDVMEIKFFCDTMRDRT